MRNENPTSLGVWGNLYNLNTEGEATSKAFASHKSVLAQLLSWCRLFSENPQWTSPHGLCMQIGPDLMANGD